MIFVIFFSMIAAAAAASISSLIVVIIVVVRGFFVVRVVVLAAAEVALVAVRAGRSTVARPGRATAHVAVQTVKGLIGALMGHRLVAIVASVVGREGSWDVDPSWERRRQRRWHVEQ